MNEYLFHGNLITSNRILYTPSVFARANLLHLQETGVLEAKKSHTNKHQKLISYLFFEVGNGSGTLQYENHQYALHSGDCVFIDCRKSYAHYASDKNLWKLHWAHLYGPTMNNIYEKYVERDGLPTFHPHNVDPFLSLMKELYKIAESNEYVTDMSIQGNPA